MKMNKIRNTTTSKGKIQKTKKLKIKTTSKGRC
jgi:hypothetical protein